MPSPARILYVDDNQDSLDLVTAMLLYANLDCQVTTAKSAESAVSLRKAQAFDLFIFDYALPLMSGVELCRQIRESDSTTPILFFTAMTHPANRAAAMGAGASEFLIKPNDLEKLTETVRRLLSEKPPASCLVPGSYVKI